MLQEIEILEKSLRQIRSKINTICEVSFGLIQRPQEAIQIELRFHFPGLYLRDLSQRYELTPEARSDSYFQRGVERFVLGSIAMVNQYIKDHGGL